jgi:hypothetical protein
MITMLCGCTLALQVKTTRPSTVYSARGEHTGECMGQDECGRDSGVRNAFSALLLVVTQSYNHLRGQVRTGLLRNYLAQSSAGASPIPISDIEQRPISFACHTN